MPATVPPERRLRRTTHRRDIAVIMSGSRLGRRLRLVASVTLALATVALVGIVTVRSWQSSHRQQAAVALERSGIAYLRPEIHLITVLAGGELTIARNAHFDTAPLRAAEAEVDSTVTAAGAGTLDNVARWADLRDRIDALMTHPDAGAGATQSWADTVGVAGQLLDAVTAQAGLDLDPDLASHNLIGAAVHALPSVIIYAGRAGGIAAQAVGRGPSAAEETELAVDTYQVALLAAQLDTEITAGADAAPDITTQLDAFESAVSTFVPPSVVTRPVGTVPLVGLADSAQTVQAAALALATDLLLRADTMLADRAGGLRDDGILAVSVGVALLVTAAALVWLLVPARRRTGDAAEPGDIDSDSGPRLAPGDLIDARALLEELAHVGRGVRAPAAGKSRTDAR